MRRIALLGTVLLLAGCLSSPNRPPEVIAAGGVVYPEAARAQHLEGFVRVEYDVSIDGTVSNAHVIESQPPGVFDEVALAAVRSWRFHPAVRNGKAVAAQGQVSRVNFKLGESEGYAR